MIVCVISALNFAVKKLRGEITMSCDVVFIDDTIFILAGVDFLYDSSECNFSLKF